MRGGLPSSAVALCGLLVASAALPVPARAEQSAPEVEIEARRVELDRASGQALFEGAVRLRHGELEIRCERLSAEVGSDGRLTAIVATGGVSIQTGGVTASAGSARYQPGAGLLTLSGRPRVQSREGELSGRSIVIRLRDQRVSVEGARGVFRIR